MYYNKYNKYKKKYIELKNKLKNDIFKGGDFVENDFVDTLKQDTRKVNDEFFLLHYHGEVVRDTFKIPSNIVLILSNCCGVSNYGSELEWYDPFQKENIQTLSKEDLLDEINDGKLSIGGQEYLVVNPGSTLCDFNLSTLESNMAVGLHTKKFDETPFYDTMINLNNKIDFDKNIKSMQDYVATLTPETFKEVILNDSLNYKPNSFKYFKTSIDIQVLFYIFERNYENLFSVANLDNIIEFFRLFLNYTKFTEYSSPRQDLFKKKYTRYSNSIGIGSSTTVSTNLTNFDILLFIFFNILIKKEPEGKKLSDILDTLSHSNGPKLTFILLYACQGTSDGCIDFCYKTLHNKSNTHISELFTNIGRNKKEGVILIQNEEPQISFKGNYPDLISKLKDMGQIDGYTRFINTHLLNDNNLVVFINLFYDMVNNINEVITSDDGMEYELVGKLIYLDERHTISTISEETIENFYGISQPSNYRILSLIVNTPSQFKSFMVNFYRFIKILVEFTGTEVNVTNFRNRFVHHKYELYNKLVRFAKTFTLKFPNDLNNEKQLINLLKFDGFFNTQEDKRLFCANPKNFLEGKKSILTNFQIFIKSKYPGHNIEAFYELNNLIVPRYYINLKIEYINSLINYVTCKKLMSEIPSDFPSSKPAPTHQVATRDAW